MLKNMVFPVFALCVAGCTIYFFLTSDFYLVLANAYIAIFGFLMFLFRASIYKFFLFVWIILQAAIIKLESPLELPLDNFGLATTYVSQFDFSQALLLSHEKAQVTVNGSLIRFNLLTPIYLGVFTVLLLLKDPQHDVLKRPKATKYGGQTFEIRLFRWNRIMERIAPQKVEVLMKVDFSESKNWLLVRLTKPAKFKKDQIVYNALIKSKDNRKLKNGIKGQLAYFRIIVDRKALKQGQLSLGKTRFVDWVFVN